MQTVQRLIYSDWIKMNDFHISITKQKIFRINSLCHVMNRNLFVARSKIISNTIGRCWLSPSGAWFLPRRMENALHFIKPWRERRGNYLFLIWSFRHSIWSKGHFALNYYQGDATENPNDSFILRPFHLNASLQMTRWNLSSFFKNQNSDKTKSIHWVNKIVMMIANK